MKVHLVEDDELSAEVIKKCLENADCEVQHFSSAESYLEHGVNEAPDVLVADYYLPGISGFELIEQKKEVLPETRFI